MEGTGSSAGEDTGGPLLDVGGLVAPLHCPAVLTPSPPEWLTLPLTPSFPLTAPSLLSPSRALPRHRQCPHTLLHTRTVDTSLAEVTPRHSSHCALSRLSRQSSSHPDWGQWAASLRSMWAGLRTKWEWGGGEEGRNGAANAVQCSGCGGGRGRAGGGGGSARRVVRWSAAKCRCEAVDHCQR